MEDVLDVYHRPYDPAFPVVCMDETSKQLIKEVREPLSMKPGSAAKYDVEYERNGVCNIFMAFEPLQGKRFIDIRRHRKKEDWALFIKSLVDDHYPDARKIVLVMDNLNTHSPASLYATFTASQARRITEKLEIHFTPVHGSWLNVAEIELSILTRQCLDRRIADADFLISETRAWQEKRNKAATKLNWQFTTEDARIKLKRLYPILN